MPSRTSATAVSWAACAALGVALLTGCGGDGDLASSPGESPAATSSTTTAPTVSESPSPSATATATRTATKTPTAAPSPAWPKALGEPQQGDPVWAVYLAIGHSANDPAIDQALSTAAGLGYQAVVGDLACDAGAIDALGLDQFDYWSGATLYFATEKQARTFAAAYTDEVGAPKGVTKVNVGCLD